MSADEALAKHGDQPHARAGRAMQFDLCGGMNGSSTSLEDPV